MPKWQFTLSATQANTEVVRIARVRTGREKILVFDGKYHGHLESTLGAAEDGTVRPEYTGLPAEVTATSGSCRSTTWRLVTAHGGLTSEWGLQPDS